MRSTLMALAAAAGASAAAPASASAVGQIHIAYTGVLGQLSVDFVSGDAGGAVAWSSDNKTFATANTTSFYYDTIGNLHQGTMSFPPTPGAPGYYRVGGGASGLWSPTFAVTPVPAAFPAQRYAVFGDFGYANDVCMNDLIKSAQAGAFDAVLHVGDWAYNLDSSSSAVGNDFMSDIQGYAAIVPVMPAAGNHEACTSCAESPVLPHSANNFTQYSMRMWSVALNAGKNAGTGTNFYYSFNQGLVHFLVFTAEAYAYKSGPEFIAAQLAFMKKDLAAVDRTVTPHVVGLAHKDWTMEPEAYADFAPILQDGGVDVLFVGHVHYYNRFKPYDVVTGATDNASVSPDGHTYTNPKYMVTVVTGAAGDHEGESSCKSPASYSIACSENYGYGIFQATNATHMQWSFKTVKADGSGPADFADELTIIKTADSRRRR